MWTVVFNDADALKCFRTNHEGRVSRVNDLASDRQVRVDSIEQVFLRAGV
jgi:hypothetical protein